KIVLGGAGGVGKTSLLHRYLTRSFDEKSKMTIGCQFHNQTLERQNRKISMVMWDLGGQSRFRFIQPEYVKGAVGAFILFDLSDPVTFSNVADEWIPLLRNNANPTIPIVLVGSKMDLVDEAMLARMTASAQELVKQYNLTAFIATSAKWGINIDETILYLVDVLIWQAFQSEEGTGTTQSSA
nr:Rab family GTPase [Candidatus Sigynarchaeota archaeon]